MINVEQVKIFYAPNGYLQLEKDINEWLSSGKFEVTRIQTTVTGSSSSSGYIHVFIFYKINQISPRLEDLENISENISG